MVLSVGPVTDFNRNDDGLLISSMATGLSTDLGEKDLKKKQDKTPQGFKRRLQLDSLPTSNGGLEAQTLQGFEDSLYLGFVIALLGRQVYLPRKPFPSAY